MRNLLYFILLCWAAGAHAGTIRVTVYTAENLPFPGAVVTLQGVHAHAAATHGVVDSAARITFQPVQAGEYIIVATAPGVSTVSTGPFVWQGRDTAITLVLPTNVRELAGVTITAGKPLVVANGEKFIYNTENDPSLAGLSASEALARTPFVSVDGEGHVQLKGKGGFIIMLNGKQTSMFANNPGEALKAFPASIISKIEVSTQPSAKYEGEGINGIINIITKKKVAGYNMHTSLTYNTIGQVNPNMAFNLKYGKLGITSFVYFANSMNFHAHGKQVYTPLITAPFAERRTLDTTITNGYMAGGNLEVAYDIDSLRTLSLYGRLAAGGKTLEQQSFISFYGAGEDLLQQSRLTSEDESHSPSGEAGFDYQQHFLQPGRSLFVGVNVQAGAQKKILQSGQVYATGDERLLHNQYRGSNTQTSIQADYTLPLHPSVMLEVGAKTIFRQVGSVYTSQVKDEGAEQYHSDLANDDELAYTQNVWGLYSMGTWKIKHSGITFKAGGRLEKTKVQGHFIRKQTDVAQDYYNFLPSFSGTKNWEGGRRLTLQYSRTLTRPGLTFLNPYTDNRDPLLITRGNERLQPEFTNNAEVSFSDFNNTFSYSLALSGASTHGGIQRYIRFDEATGISTQKYNNIGRSLVAGVSGYFSANPVKQFSATLNFSCYYADFNNTANDTEKGSGLYGSFSTALTYLPNEKWMFFNNINYAMPALQLQGRSGDFLFYNIGAGYWLYKKKLRLTVAMLNFLDKYWRVNDRFESPQVRQQSTSFRAVRTFSVGLRFNFGRLKENTSRKRGVNIDDAKQEPR